MKRGGEKRGGREKAREKVGGEDTEKYTETCPRWIGRRHDNNCVLSFQRKNRVNRQQEEKEEANKEKKNNDDEDYKEEGDDDEEEKKRRLNSRQLQARREKEERRYKEDVT